MYRMLQGQRPRHLFTSGAKADIIEPTFPVMSAAKGQPISHDVGMRIPAGKPGLAVCEPPLHCR